MSGPDFGKMIGPLPLGAWVVVVGGGLGYTLWNRRNGSGGGSDSPTVVDDTSGTPGVGDGSVGGWTPTTPGTSTSGGGTGLLTIDDNDEWASAAIRYLISQGYDATVSTSAISKYVNAEPLSPAEFTLLGRALLYLGPPPTILPAPTQVPTTAPPPVKPPVKPPVVKPPAPKPSKPPRPAKPPAKPTFRYYTVRKGDSLAKIAHAYHTNWQTLYNLNRAGKRRKDGSFGMIANPNLIRPGWKLILP